METKNLKFQIGQCPKCGRRGELMLSNNPLSGPTICFHCIAENLNTADLNHAEFFCRTYNLPWNPQLWISLAEDEKGEELFKQYTLLCLNDPTNQPNLGYSSSTKDL